MANIRPLSDNVLIKPIEAEEKTASGILLSESSKEKTKRGTVVAAGPGKFDDGKLVPLQVKVGETVLYSWGDEIKVNGEEYVIVSESSIQAVIE